MQDVTSVTSDKYLFIPVKRKLLICKPEEIKASLFRGLHNTYNQCHHSVNPFNAIGKELGAYLHQGL